MDSTGLSRLTRDTLFAMKLSSHALRKGLKDTPYLIPRNATHAQLARLYARALRSLLDYEYCFTEELQTFCKQRRLQYFVMKPNRATLINLLDQADEDRTFHGFESLPAELREYIFQLCIVDFSKTNVKERMVSPLSQVSRLVRLESLPLFYKMCVFTLNVVDAQVPQRDGLNDVTPQKCLDAKAEEWLSMTPSHYINVIRRLRISGVVWRQRDVGSSPIPGFVYWGVWNIDLDASTCDRVTEYTTRRRKVLLPQRFKREAGWKRVESRLSDAVDVLVQGSIDRDSIRRLAQAFQS